MLFALVCGINFKAKDEEGNMLKADLEFTELHSCGTKSVLTAVCGFDESKNQQLFIDAERIDSLLQIYRSKDSRSSCKL
jgi:hypothetical protein